MLSLDVIFNYFLERKFGGSLLSFITAYLQEELIAAAGECAIKIMEEKRPMS